MPAPGGDGCARDLTGAVNMARGARRRPMFATRSADRQRETTLHLLRHYDRDPGFVAAVAALIQRHRDALTWIAEERSSWGRVAADRRTDPDLTSYTKSV